MVLVNTLKTEGGFSETLTSLTNDETFLTHNPLLSKEKVLKSFLNFKDGLNKDGEGKIDTKRLTSYLKSQTSKKKCTRTSLGNKIDEVN